MNEYDLAEAFRRIENELMASMIRNMARHRVEEIGEGYQWSMWQAEMLKSLERYKRNNRRKYGKQFKSINSQIAALIREARAQGSMRQEIAILRAIQRGWKYPQIPENILQAMEGLEGADISQKIPRLLEMLLEGKTGKFTGEFFGLNDRKLDALIKATMQDMERAETAILRKANDDFRKAIFNAQVYANTGAGTYEQAVDMATKDMLSRGLNCVEYANGARHTLADYADMAIRTACKRAYLQGEGEMRKRWGITTVIMNKRGNPCPKCLPFCGKVLIDDVWSGGSPDDGPWPLMSRAVEAGLYHPRCRDSHTTYFPGITTADGSWTEEELEAIGQSSRQEARQQYAERQAAKFGRLAKYSLDEENRKRYQEKTEEWGEQADLFRSIKQKTNQLIERIFEHEPVGIFDLKSKYRNDILDMINHAPQNMRDFIIKRQNSIVFINEHAGRNREGKKGIRVSFKKDATDERGKWCGIFHEIGHRVDRLAGRPSEKPEFEKALRNDFERLVKGYQERYNVSRSDAYKEMSGMIQGPAYHSVSDLLGGMSDNELVGSYRHRLEYWQKQGRLGREAFAHFFEAVSRNDAVKTEILRQTFPEAYQMFENMLEELT